MHYYAGIPIACTNFITDALTKGGNSDTSEIYALSLQEGFGVVGLQNENTMGNPPTAPTPARTLLPGPRVIQIGPMETKDGKKWRVRWYLSLSPPIYCAASHALTASESKEGLGDRG